METRKSHRHSHRKKVLPEIYLTRLLSTKVSARQVISCHFMFPPHHMLKEIQHIFLVASSAGGSSFIQIYDVFFVLVGEKVTVFVYNINVQDEEQLLLKYICGI